jgi:UPF0716 protein FxsA
MAWLLLILFFAVPLIEIWLLIEVGGWIGAIPTIALVVFTAVLGALMLRWQGFGILIRARRMLTPGFFTDAIGFLLMIPPLRRRLVLWLVARSLAVHRPPPGDERRQGPRTIEGEFWREKDRRDR